MVDEPRPDYSYPEFPAPISLQPTPTFDPAAHELTGYITSAMDGLRVGEISLSFSAGGDTLDTIQLHIYRITCSVQTDNSVTVYAVDDSKPVIQGPIPLAGTDFYVDQAPAVIHGVFIFPDDAHGTLYLRYADPVSQTDCDLGNFDWTAAPRSG